MVKIVDCFSFYNELDMLNYRLNVMNSCVDYFIIVEATHTHSGKEKQLFFEENKALFKTFEDKIIHIVVDDFPHKFPNIDYANREQWNNEKFQRNAITRGLEKIPDLADDDIIIITDLDEIPDPRTVALIKSKELQIDVHAFEMDLYYYNLNTKQKMKWVQGKALTFKTFKTLNKTCSDIFAMRCPLIPNGGWHLSYFGDEHFIRNKIMHFAHQEFNSDHYTNAEKIKARVESQEDLYGYSTMINIAVADNTYLPVEYETYLGKFYKK